MDRLLQRQQRIELWVPEIIAGEFPMNGIAGSSNVRPFAPRCASWTSDRIRSLNETGHRHAGGLALPPEASCGLRTPEGAQEDLESAIRLQRGAGLEAFWHRRMHQMRLGRTPFQASVPDAPFHAVGVRTQVMRV